MKTSLSAKLLSIGVGIILATPLAHGTDSYEYKPGETLVIDHGLSPDKQFSISAGVSGKGEARQFHLFLVDAKTKKRIGPLEEAVDQLDSGAKSIQAAWAPDSHHVAITYRVDRHELVMYLYRIADRRAFLVTGEPDLMLAVKESKNVDTSQRNEFFVEPKWLDASRFKLFQESQYRRVAPNPAPVLGAYASVEPEEDGEDNKKSFVLHFAADGVCELTANDKYRVVSVKPHPQKDAAH